MLDLLRYKCLKLFQVDQNAPGKQALSHTLFALYKYGIGCVGGLEGIVLRYLQRMLVIPYSLDDLLDQLLHLVGSTVSFVV